GFTSKTLGEISPFSSSSRVFLSANSLNIQVFRAVADHPKFRHDIREIIWDDARFMSAPLIWEERAPNHQPRTIGNTATWTDLTILHVSTRWMPKCRWEPAGSITGNFVMIRHSHGSKRVTVTLTAHGWLFAPLYET
ncbi:uncharacterized protein N7496_002073, partial [Penicillium cataractarum]